MPDASLPRNAFDRGYSVKFNFSAGILSPTFAQPCVGGSKIKINQNAFVRSAAVNTSAMTSVNVYTDFFYVPIKQLFTQFGQFKTKTKDIHSSIFSSVPTTMPSLTHANLAAAIAALGNATDMLGFTASYGAERLGELLNLGFGQGFTYDVGSLNMLLPAAYQKCYFDHYRNTAYEANDPAAYNLDQFATGGSISQAVAQKMLTIRYCNYKKDFFSNLYPSLNYISSSASGMQSQWTIPSSVLGMGGVNGNVAYNNANTQPQMSNDGMVIAPTTINNSNLSYGFSVQNLRAAFALDKLVRASSYAPQHVKDQYEARYGFKSYQYNGDESQRIGSFKFAIRFGEVVSTADTSSASGGQPLGDIGGKGIGGSDWQDNIEFVCHDDCIIMGITYCIPVTTYDSLGVDKFSQKFLATDFFQPEFMDLGMQPILLKELFGSNTNSISNLIMGYQPRYSEYKIGIDRNCHQFRFNNALSAFTMHGRSTTALSGNGVTAAYFKVNPADMDSIFVQQFDGTTGSDQFFGMFEFAFACVAPMSIHGNPRL